MIYLLLADGFEEIEALTPLDVLRRAGLSVRTLSIKNGPVVGAHGVAVTADLPAEEANDPIELLILPGGMPGTKNLDACPQTDRLIQRTLSDGGRIAAICAAPMVYGHLGILEGVKATCYPGVQSELKGAEYTADIVTKDGQFITGRGPAAAMEFGYAIAEHFLGEDAVAPLREGMIYNQLFKQMLVDVYKGF